jgi:hypothetical protein
MWHATCCATCRMNGLTSMRAALVGLGLLLLPACSKAGRANTGTCMETPVCRDGRLVRMETQCCTDGRFACEWDGSPRVCADRSCVPTRSRCPEDPPAADASTATACVNSTHKVCDHGVIRVETECCEPGSACARSLPQGFCADGSCRAEGCSEDSTDAGADTDADAASNCTPVVYSTCINGKTHQQSACCPAGMTCHYGQQIEICPDRSCVTYPASCP